MAGGGGRTWKRTAEDLLQCMARGAKPYRAWSTSRLKEFQGTEANCSGTEVWGQVHTSSLLNLEVGGSGRQGQVGGSPAGQGDTPCRWVGSPEWLSGRRLPSKPPARGASQADGEQRPLSCRLDGLG